MIQDLDIEDVSLSSNDFCLAEVYFIKGITHFMCRHRCLFGYILPLWWLLTASGWYLGPLAPRDFLGTSGLGVRGLSTRGPLLCVPSIRKLCGPKDTGGSACGRWSLMPSCTCCPLVLPRGHP